MFLLEYGITIGKWGLHRFGTFIDWGAIFICGCLQEVGGPQQPGKSVLPILGVGDNLNPFVQ